MTNQTASSVLMRSAAHFAPNQQTAADNSFQELGDGSSESLKKIAVAAQRELSSFAELLGTKGIHVVIERSSPSECPDAIFPNNCFSVHEDGTHILYPMYAENRRAELNQPLLDFLSSKYPKRIDLRELSSRGLALEGTGSLVLDRVSKSAFVAISKRSSAAAVQDWCTKTGFSAFTFETADRLGNSVYHTNVMMSVGSKLAIVCLDALKDGANELQSKLEGLGKKVLPISLDQLGSFCGNALELTNSKQQPVLVFSESARKHFSREQLQTLERFGELACPNLSTIERYSGGSARCMLAELF